MADEATHGKLDDAEHQAQQGYHAKEHHGGLSMEDILHGGACDNHQRTAPEVERQVLDADNLLVKTMHGVLHDIGQQHGHYQQYHDLIEYLQEGTHKGDIGSLLNHRETNGYHQHRDEIRKESIGGGLFQRAAQLLGHHSGGGGTRRNNAHQQSLQQNKGRVKSE